MDQLQQYFLEHQTLALHNVASIPSEITITVHDVHNAGNSTNDVKDRTRMNDKVYNFFKQKTSSTASDEVTHSTGCASTEAETESFCSSLSDRSNDFWPSFENINDSTMKYVQNRTKKICVIATDVEDDLPEDLTEIEDSFVRPVRVRSRRREAHPKLLLQKKR